MAELHLERVTISNEENILTIFHNDRPQDAVSMDIDGIMKLIEFVAALKDSGFTRRGAFRILLWEGCGLSIELEAGGASVATQPIDISFSGVFVTISEPDWIPISLDSDVRVTMKLDKLSATLPGIVKRSPGTGYGIHFPKSSGGNSDHSPEFTKIVMALQRRSAARRISQA